MKDKHRVIVYIALIMMVTCICVTGLMTNAEITNTLKVDMDEETRDYLVAHDYCAMMVDSSEFAFIGDCKYLEPNLIKLLENDRKQTNITNIKCWQENTNPLEDCKINLTEI